MTISTHATATNGAVLRLLTEGAAVCRQADRDDLAELLEVAAERARRPTTVVCVVGEYKQGKSQLVNSLVGIDACPVDDDLATSAITVVSHGEHATARVRRVEDGTRTTDTVAIEEVGRFAADAGGAEGSDSIETVELTVPSPFLETGVAVVDTPGVNAFGPENSAAVLDFLPWADGVVLVTDASAELSPPELRFLVAAQKVCPSVQIVLSKIDLYPEWRRIAEFDRSHLAALELGSALIPVSSTLEQTARAAGDEGLKRESGFADLLRAVEGGILGNARQRSAARALNELGRAIVALRSVETARLAALEGPAAAKQQLDELRQAQWAIGRLEAADAQWTVVLNDGFNELTNDLEYRLHDELKREGQRADRQLTEGNPSEVIDEMFAELRSVVSTVGQEAFNAAADGTNRIGGEISELIAETIPAQSLDRPVALNVEEMWSSVERDLRTKGPGVLSSGLGALLNGSSMIGMIGLFASIAGTALLGPLSWGAAALYGAHQYRAGRSSAHERQRDEARTVVRELIERAEVELGRRVGLALHEARQSLRQVFGARIEELSSTYASAVEALEESRLIDERERSERAGASRQRIAELDDFARAVALEAGFTS